MMWKGKPKDVTSTTDDGDDDDGYQCCRRWRWWCCLTTLFTSIGQHQPESCMAQTRNAPHTLGATENRVQRRYTCTSIVVAFNLMSDWQRSYPQQQKNHIQNKNEIFFGNNFYFKTICWSRFIYATISDPRSIPVQSSSPKVPEQKWMNINTNWCRPLRQLPKIVFLGLTNHNNKNTIVNGTAALWSMAWNS